MKRYVLILGLMWLTVGVAYVHLGQPSLGTDDAHIFFVYGQNVAAGKGMVYNPGGERVEGYTSPLWMLMVAGAFALFAKPEGWLLAASVLMVAGAVTALWRFVDGAAQVTLRGLLLVAWVFSSPSFVVWVSLTLMDIALWSSLLILGTIVALSASSPRRLAVLVSLIPLARPEGMLWDLVLIGIAGLVTATQRGLAEAWHEARLPLGVYGIVLGGLLVWRMAYFGYPLPNTYYAKMSPDILYNLRLGMAYLLLFAYSNGQVLVGLVPMVTGLLLNVPKILTALESPFTKVFDKARVQYAAVSLIVLTGLLVPVWTGGDHFRLFRFYQPIWPLLILPAFGLMDVLRCNIPRPARYGLATLAVVTFFATPWVNWGNHLYSDAIRHEFAIAEDGEAVGVTLNALFEGDLPSIGVITAGGVALEYKGTVIDVMGLNNLAMAHAPGDRYGEKNHAAFNADVFLAQRPNLFLPMSGARQTLVRRCQEIKSLNNQLKGLLEDERFVAMYQLALISGSDKHILAYVERSYLATLVERGFEVEVIDCLKVQLWETYYV